MATVGFVLHHERSLAAELAREATAWLVAEGHQVRIPTPGRRHRRPGLRTAVPRTSWGRGSTWR